MEKHNYKDEIKEQIRLYLKDTDERDYEKLYDEMWASDNVTGNGSGSFYFNTWAAEESLCHNLDLLEDACEEFGSDLGECLAKGAENADVTIRCYLLGECLSEVLDETEREENGTKH